MGFPGYNESQAAYGTSRDGLPPKPKLVLQRKNLHDVPPVAVPPDYRIRSYRPGYETAWEDIIVEGFGSEGRRQFDDTMAKDPAFNPDCVLFCLHHDEPVGTASAWHRNTDGPQTGRLHLLAVKKGHRGKRLGYNLCAAVLQKFTAQARSRALLKTEDSRLAAITTYLKLDFLPFLTHENQRDRWRNILKQLGPNAYWAEELYGSLNGALHDPIA